MINEAVHCKKYIIFEEQIHLDHTSFINGTIPSTHVLIEQKSLGRLEPEGTPPPGFLVVFWCRSYEQHRQDWHETAKICPCLQEPL